MLKRSDRRGDNADISCRQIPATCKCLHTVPHGPRAQACSNRSQEIRNNTHGWDMKSDIWSLGAVLYHMMVGTPPVDAERDVYDPPTLGRYHYHVKSFPERYSKELCDIVKAMLQFKKEARPTAADLSPRVGAGFRIWRETDEEGWSYVGKGESRRRNNLLF